MTREELIERVNKFQGANREFSQELPPIVEALCDEIDEAGVEVVDNLTSNARDKALSANMGKKLKIQVGEKISLPEVSGESGQFLGVDAEGNPEWQPVSSTGEPADAKMSYISTNALQNKVITEELDKCAKKDGYYDSLTAGLATNLVDTKGTGTEQEFIRRTSCGNESISDDGTGVIQEIKGKTIAWNQLVNEDTTEVTIPSGHKYFAIIGGTASVATSDGTAIAVTGGVDVVTDLTLLGLGDLTADQFRALYPALYYAPASVLKSNDAAALLTDGFNQWDEEWELGTINTQGQPAANNNQIRSKNYIPVIGGMTYYIKGALQIHQYRADKSYIDNRTFVTNATITLASDASYIKFRSSDGVTTYNNDICINLSWSGYRNGEYEPYWQHVLALNLAQVTGIPEGGTEADRVTIFPNGLGGAGSAFDSLFVENGVTKARKTMLAEIDLGELIGWTFATIGSYNRFTKGSTSIKASGGGDIKGNLICSKYDIATPDVAYVGNTDKVIGVDGDAPTLYLVDSSLASTDIVDGKIAKLAGVKVIGESASGPIVYTDLQYADGTPFTMPKVYQVADFGTETIVQPEGATEPSAPFRGVIKYNDDLTREIVNLPKNYDTTDGIDALCSALATALSSALNGTLTITRGNYSESDRRYAFTVTFTPNE